MNDIGERSAVEPSLFEKYPGTTIAVLLVLILGIIELAAYFVVHQPGFYVEYNRKVSGYTVFKNNPKHQLVTQKRNDNAPDVILDLCSHCENDGDLIPMTPSLRKRILEANDRMASQALRVLAIACRPLQEADVEGSEWSRVRNLVFVGLTGMIDPPRPEVRDAVATSRRAGLKAVMITGDHQDTAVAIAQELDLLNPGHVSLTGMDLDRMTDEELVERVENVDVYARVSRGCPQPGERIRRRGTFRRAPLQLKPRVDDSAR